MRPFIVGIDPGATSAFAALSFDFKVLRVKSKKSYSLAGLIYDIYKEGYPLIVATDKKEIPSFIKEFSQKTGAKIFSPKYDTKKGEKQYIIKQKGFSEHTKNTHETDALASAVLAYREYYPLIKKIKTFVLENKKKELEDALLAKVISQEKNIQKALLEIELQNKKKDEKEIINPVKRIFQKELNKEEREIFLLKKSIDRLREKLKELEKENKILKDRRIDINDEIKKIISFKEKRALALIKENNILKKKINEKNLEINKLNDFIIKAKDSVLIKKLKNLSSREYEIKKDLLKIDKDVIYVENAVLSENVLNDLKHRNEILIIDFQKTDIGIIKKLEKYFLVADKNKLNLYECGNFFLADKKEFENIKNNLLKEKDKKGLLNEIIEDYKHERKKELLEK